VGKKREKKNKRRFLPLSLQHYKNTPYVTKKSTQFNTLATLTVFCIILVKYKSAVFCTKSASITASKYVIQLEVKLWMILKNTAPFIFVVNTICGGE
jgi:hypothetical protein